MYMERKKDKTVFTDAGSLCSPKLPAEYDSLGYNRDIRGDL